VELVHLVGFIIKKIMYLAILLEYVRVFDDGRSFTACEFKN